MSHQVAIDPNGYSSQNSSWPDAITSLAANSHNGKTNSALAYLLPLLLCWLEHHLGRSLHLIVATKTTHSRHKAIPQEKGNSYSALSARSDDWIVISDRPPHWLPKGLAFHPPKTQNRPKMWNVVLLYHSATIWLLMNRSTQKSISLVIDRDQLLEH